MPDEQIDGVKFSEFPSATPESSDEVVGLHIGYNARFSISNLTLAIRQGLANLFVPLTRKINGKVLSSDITLDASDVGAVDSANVGTENGVASLDSTGKVPSSQLPAIPTTAAGVSYDNTASGLAADDVQEALDELAAGAGGSTAATTSYDNTDSGLAATNAQDAIDELADEKADQTTVAPVEASATATAAHALGSIFYLEGVLYRALSDIAIGDTINTGTGGNATQTKISENFKRTVTLTSAQYAQLSAAEKAADIVYIITDDPPPAISTSTPNMDGTGAAGSTGEVSDAGHTHPSDTSKADKTDLAEIQATGSTNTTGEDITAGTYFYLNGVLVRAKASIADGASFTLNTNYEVAPGGGLNAIQNTPITTRELTTFTGTTGTLVTLNANTSTFDLISIQVYATDGTTVVANVLMPRPLLAGIVVKAYGESSSQWGSFELQSNNYQARFNRTSANTSKVVVYGINIRR